jgi:hypothetical protein
MNGLNQFLLAVMICLTVTCFSQADAAGAALYQGTFTGKVIGDRDTSAPLTLELTQNGDAVTGTATIGGGVGIDTGGFICPGFVAVPSGMIGVNGTVSSNDPRHLEAKSGLSASGLTITVNVLADVFSDGSTMNVQLDLNIPWPCQSTTLKATLTRSN